MSSTQVTSTPLMKPRVYRRVEDENALPQVAVKDKKTVTVEEAQALATAAANAAEDKTLNPEEHDWKKRYADLRRYEQQQANKYKEEMATLKAELSTLKAGPAKTLPKTEAEVTDWAKQYPDVFNIIRTVASKENSAHLDALQDQIDALNVKLTVSDQEKALHILKGLHPDLEDLQNSEQFHDWVATQPQKLQDAIYKEGDPYVAGTVIDAYKAKNKAPKPKKDPKPDASLAVLSQPAIAPPDSTAGDGETIKESWILSLKPKEFDKYEESIDKARAEGRVIYDVPRKK